MHSAFPEPCPLLGRLRSRFQCLFWTHLHWDSVIQTLKSFLSPCTGPLSLALICPLTSVLSFEDFHILPCSMLDQLIFLMKISQVPEFEEAAFSAPLNKVVRCKTKFGLHLLQVLSERYSNHSFAQACYLIKLLCCH